MKRSVVAVVVSVVLMSGVLVAGGIALGAADAREQETDAGQPETDVAPARDARLGILDEVLRRLVDDGTLDRAQATAVAAALRDEAAERRRVHRAARRGVAAGFRLGRLLDGGVIDADELATLPGEHPLRNLDGPAAEYLEDGILTVEELRMLIERFVGRCDPP